MKKILIFILKSYQLCISPFLGTCCRFYPSCSEYAKEAITHKTLVQALYLIIKRLLKCGPWHKGGYDPLPPPTDKK